jgi:AcrR family transcriptional regulator
MAPSSSTRRSQAERRAETEQRVLEATMSIIAERGVHAVTAASVGEAAGYSRGIVNHQFGTREALLKVVAETVQARFDPNPEDRHGRDHVTALVVRYLSSLRTEPQDIRVFLRLMTAAISGEEPGLHQVFVQRDEHLRQHVTDALTDGQGDHSVRSDIDPALLATLIVGLLRGVALQLQLAPDLVGLDALIEEAAELIDSTIKRG